PRLQRRGPQDSSGEQDLGDAHPSGTRRDHAATGRGSDTSNRGGRRGALHQNFCSSKGDVMKKGLLIGFVGSPYSGKTTTAALLFAELKKCGIQAEYLPEYARDRIREMKDLGVPVVLDDAAQWAIRDIQEKLERRHLANNGEGAITITDGSTANSFFYGGSDSLEREVVRYDLLFFSRNIQSRTGKDDNRIHDLDFSREMEKKIVEELSALCPVVRSRVVELFGDIDFRLFKAYN